MLQPTGVVGEAQQETGREVVRFIKGDLPTAVDLPAPSSLSSVQLHLPVERFQVSPGKVFPSQEQTADLLEIGGVQHRVGVKQHEVGHLAYLDGAEIVLSPGKLRAAQGTRL